MTTIVRSCVLGAGLVLAASLAGCGKGNPERGADAGASPAPGTPGALIADFTVRGQVAQLPEAGKPASAFRVHHEPIPEWKRNYNDETPVGMNAMVMEFPPASPGVIEGIAAGDIVRMTFRVEYGEDGKLAGWKAIKVEKLPADTPLVFERPKAPAPGEAAPSHE